MSSGATRRQVITAGGLAVTGSLFGPAVAPAAADRIVRATRRPRIPGRQVLVTAFGAVGDGTTDCTGAFAAAIAALARHGGGRVVVPPGRFRTGAIHLDNHIELRVERGATIAFDTDPAAYLPAVYTRDGGIECLNYSPFLYAFGKHDIAVTGDGVLDGQADNEHWWPWAGKAQFGWQPGMPTGAADGALLADLADRGVPVPERVFGAGHYLRPQFIQPYRCQRVLISGITLHNTPNWQLNPVLCTDVTVEGVTASSLGPNNDGCDPESCDRVVIRDCVFETGDDCIAVKAGKNADGRRVDRPCQHVVVQDCVFLAGHGAITIGSEMSGGVRQLYVRDCREDGPALNEGLRLKTNSARGGFIEQVYVRDVTIGALADSAILVDFSYGEGPGHGYDPTVRDIHVERLTVGSTVYPVYAVGYPEDHITGLSVRDSTVEHATHDSVLRYCDDVTFDRFLVNGEPASGSGG